MATMTNTPIISEAAIDLILQILEDRIDDLIVRALSKDKVIEKLNKEPGLKKLVRIIVAEIKNEKGGKNHPIFGKIAVKTRNEAFWENPTLETSVGYLKWMKELDINWPAGLTDDDWQSAATLASGYFCTKRYQTKLSCIKAAFTHGWKKDGAKVATKDLPAHLKTDLGQKQLREFILSEFMGQKDAPKCFSPPVAFTNFVLAHLVSCEPFETLEQAKVHLKVQTRNEKNEETLEALNEVYERAKNAREEPAPISVEKNNTNEMVSSVPRPNNNNIVAPHLIATSDPFTQPATPRTQRASVSRPTINFVGSSLRSNAEARNPLSVSVASPPEICNNTNQSREEPTIDDELDAIDLAAVVVEESAVPVERPRRGRPAKKASPQTSEPAKEKSSTKNKKPTKKTTTKTTTKSNKRKATEEPLVDQRNGKRNKTGST